ncbi:AAA family ATPase [Kovacikia minuta CCNUW1]|uniref:AAA family ATPase n=1 Tax=Kovacikia minuta TaxID=2931930 RepID=UPI001CCD184E|nr:AAA family ATPase [Kovacikia minuta]UBF26777.1 AAA family ATPase [Kovacikia minuta CCNUW1]
MQSDSVEPFPDNWTYLRAELAWLDRVLALAVARHRKETKEVDRFAHSRADRVTSHWWKGLVTLEGEVSYDSPVEMPRRRSPQLGYQQQIDAKVQVSQQRGISLGIPSLCRRLQLNAFEKNLVLMTLAPEVNRRYGRLYSYLQEMEQTGGTGLPTVDLILRILCRNDAEWQAARRYLAADSVLIQQQLLTVEPLQKEALLTRFIKLVDPLVNYLLADQPKLADLEALLCPLSPVSDRPCLSLVDHLPVLPQPISPSLIDCWTPPIDEPSHSPNPWSDLVLPDALMADLQHLCQRVQFAEQVDEIWGFQQLSHPLQSSVQRGAIALLVGSTGTGKTSAAQAIAQILAIPLFYVDLALLKATDQPRLLTEIAAQSPRLLLIKSAEVWFNRNSELSEAELNQFWNGRQSSPGITLLSTTQKQCIRPKWRRQIYPILEFPIPDEPSRLRLWQQSFPAQVPLDCTIDWAKLAHQFRLTGGEIRAIAREAAFYAMESPNLKLGMEHLVRAYKVVKGKR